MNEEPMDEKITLQTSSPFSRNTTLFALDHASCSVSLIRFLLATITSCYGNHV
jgi:hypothetical protein